MPLADPSFINQVQPYKPPCPDCGAPTSLIGIEPTSTPGTDRRTFESSVCRRQNEVEVTLPG